MKTKYYFTLNEIRGGILDWDYFLNESNTATQSSISTKLFTDYIIPRYDDAYIVISKDESVVWDGHTVQKKMLAWLNSTFPYYSKLIGLYENEELDLMKALETVSTDNRAITTSGGNTNTAVMGAQHSENRENDTPQNGGLFDDDNHTSNISTNDYNGYTNTYTLLYNNEKRQHSGNITTTTEPDTIINRLTEIREKYTNLYAEWADKFRIFIYHPATFEERNDYGWIYYED